MTQNRPAPPSPIFPSGEKLNSTAATHARELHGEILRHSARIREIELEHTQAVRAVRDAEDAITAQVREDTPDGAREVELADELKAARVKADSYLHGERLRAAEYRLERAMETYRAHCERQFVTLLEELAPEAEAATKALADVRAAVAPVERRYAEIHRRVGMLVRHVLPHPGRPLTPEEVQLTQAWALPTDNGESVPLPDADLVAAWIEAHGAPEPEEKPDTETTTPASAAA